MLKTDITLPIGYASSDIKAAIAERLPITEAQIRAVEIIRRTLDISDTSKPHYKCTVAFSASAEKEHGLMKIRNKVTEYAREVYYAPSVIMPQRPVVVGAGPAGLFAALILAEAGVRPIVLERGLPARERLEKVEIFNALGILDTECNVQFGEGGAGTFSDGKLKIGSVDKYKARIIREFILSGATPDIAYSSTAHLGTDRLADIVVSLRERIISLGGEFIFSARMTDILTRDEHIVAVKYTKDGSENCIDTSAVILATGHSARDTLRHLHSIGIPMEARGFGVGMRVEHPREYINAIVYREAKDSIADTASYHLVTHLPSGRSVYSFCMCPGGTVVAATSNEEGIVTNGMSGYARMGDNSNSAILVSVTPSDFGSSNPLAGIAYQEKIERAAFSLTENYKAPVITLRDLMASSAPRDLASVKPSYPRGVLPISPEEYLPEYITSSVRAGFLDFDAWLGGFMYPDAVLTGPETRTTSPVRILRGDDGMCPTAHGLFPTGEGAGYAGGIISSAADGIRMAEKLLMKFGTPHPC